MPRTRQVLFVIVVGVCVGAVFGLASGVLTSYGFAYYGKALAWSSGLVVAIAVVVGISRSERRRLNDGRGVDGE